MGLLGDVYSYGDTLKRKVGGLLSDPRGTLEQFVGQLGDDMNTNISNMKTGYGFGGNKSVLSDPAQVQAAQKALADYGAQSGMAAATVWHGSPHKFDKFDSSKIGTGEGAQAYGHGLYLAESPDVAGQYAKQLTAPAMDGPQNHAAMISNAFKGDMGKALDFAKDAAATRPEEAAHWADVIGLLDRSPQLYKVDLPDEHIAKMLDWDKPLSQQPQSVQAAFGSVDPNGRINTGLAYERWRAQQGVDPVAASEKLKALGIPGVKYLDGGSRGAGQGSSNFVVFPGNEGLLSILERNGQALK